MTRILVGYRLHLWLLGGTLDLLGARDEPVLERIRLDPVRLLLPANTNVLVSVAHGQVPQTYPERMTPEISRPMRRVMRRRTGIRHA